jgi:predicted nucleic acid-binding protein
MIIQAAISSQAGLLLSEDFQNGQSIGAVKIINPFEEGESLSF